MGQFEVPLADLATGNHFYEKWFECKGRNKRDEVSGDVLVSAKYIEMKFDPKSEKLIREQSRCKCLLC